MSPRRCTAVRDADGPTVLRLSGRGLLLVAGLPGCGKSTLLATLDVPASVAVTVCDSSPVRAALARRIPARVPYPSYRWLVHLVHRAAVVLSALGRTDLVVVHLPATRPRVRAAIRGLARASRRGAHLLWLDVPPATALAGQRARGREVRPRAFARHVAHAARGLEALGRGEERGWDSVAVVDRGAADRGVRVEITSGAAGRTHPDADAPAQERRADDR